MLSNSERNTQSQERMKELIELAVQQGRRLQSAQTGCLHHFYHSQENDSQHTIPIKENILFVLALLRTRTMENVNEAKDLLERLLVFQNGLAKENQGNFPVYLHEYPLCRDPLLALHLLAPFYWILKGYGHVLGQELRKKTEKACHDLLEYCLSLSLNDPLPYSFAVSLASAFQAFGKLWGQQELEQQGQASLEALLKAHKTDSWHVTDHVAQLLVALQMVYPSLANSPWDDLWVYVSQTWHRGCCSYIGPCLKEEQKGHEPDPNLYDLFLGYFSGQYSARSQVPALYHLQAALIQPTDDQLIHQTIPFQLQSQHQSKNWLLNSEQSWACTLIEKDEQFNSVKERTYTPLRLIWGNAQQLHTFVCQGGNCSGLHYHVNGNQIELFIDLKQPYQADEGEHHNEINFYFDVHPPTQIRIEGQSATIFPLGQKVAIQSDTCHLSMVFNLIEGEGQFLGHLKRGNRPSQINLKGTNKFNAYDWHLFLRTIRRKGDCRLAITIQIEP